MPSPKIIVNITQSTVGNVVVGDNTSLTTGDVYVNSIPQQTKPEHQDFHLLKEVKSFQGRVNELKQLCSWMFQDKKKMAVISGLPGYGKTELARHFAHHCKEHELVRSVLWLDAETPSVLEQSLRDLLRWLGASDKAELDVRSVVQAVHQHFSARPHLFVLDNALDRRNVLGFEPEGECRCVFTSHLEDWDDDVPSLKLMPLSLDSAVDVLRAELQRRFLNKDLKQYKHLAEVLSCVPLALQVAAAYVRQEFVDLDSDFHLSDYVERLQVSSSDVIDQPLPDFSANTYDKTFLQAIQISLHKIVTATNYDSKLAVDILHICAYFNPEQIFYSSLLEVPSLKEVLNNQNSKYQIKKACALLCKYSFIYVENEKITIHRLIQFSVIQIHSRISKNKIYFSCLETLLDSSEIYKSHSNFILKYAEYRLETFDEFYNKYKLDILKNDNFFWHIINSNCKIFLLKILNGLGDGAANVINARCLLHCAVRCQQHGILELLLENYDPNVDELDGNKDTALLLAARKYKLHSIKTLVMHKANVNGVAEDGNSVLHEIIRASGQTQIIGRSLDAVVAVRRLVEFGARTKDVGLRNRSLVHAASLALNPDLVRYLVKAHGCNVNAVDMNKRTPMYYVAGSQSVDIGRQQDTVRCLLDLGANRDVKDYWGHTPAENARVTGQSDLAEYINNPSSEIQKSEPVVYELRGAVTRGDLVSLSRLLEDLGERALQVSNESCLLFEAVQHEKYDVLEMLLAQGVDVNCRTANKGTPLHHAAWNLDKRAMQHLVDHGADVNATNALGRSVLHDLIFGAGLARRAGRSGDARKTLRWLVGRGAHIDAVTSQSVSLLHAASHALCIDLVRCLATEYSLDVNAVDEAGWTPLFWVSAGLRYWRAAESRGLSTAACLLELGARVNVLNARGKTPARLASIYGYAQLAELLQPTVAWQLWQLAATALPVICILFIYLLIYLCNYIIF